MPAPLATTGWRRAVAACTLGAGAVTMTAAAASAAPGDLGTPTAPGGGSTAVFQTSQCTPTGQTMGVDLTNLSAVSHTYTITTSSGPATPSGTQLASGGHTYLQLSVPRTARAVFVYSSGQLVGSLALSGCSTSESPTASATAEATRTPTTPAASSTQPSDALPQTSTATEQAPSIETTSPVPEAPTTGTDAATSTGTSSSTTTSSTTPADTPAATALPTEPDAADPGSNNLLKGFGIGVAVLGIALGGAVLFREFKK